MAIRLLPKLLLVLVLLAGQYSTLVHSVEHSFGQHEHTLFCKAFLTAKQLSDFCLPSLSIVNHLNSIAIVDLAQTPAPVFVKLAKRPPRARAPPLIYV